MEPLRDGEPLAPAAPAPASVVGEAAPPVRPELTPSDELKCFASGLRNDGSLYHSLQFNGVVLTLAGWDAIVPQPGIPLRMSQALALATHWPNTGCNDSGTALWANVALEDLRVKAALVEDAEFARRALAGDPEIASHISHLSNVFKVGLGHEGAIPPTLIEGAELAASLCAPLSPTATLADRAARSDRLAAVHAAVSGQHDVVILQVHGLHVAEVNVYTLGDASRLRPPLFVVMNHFTGAAIPAVAVPTLPTEVIIAWVLMVCHFPALKISERVSSLRGGKPPCY